MKISIFLSALLSVFPITLLGQTPEPAGTAGKLSRGIWQNIPGYSLETLQRDHNFYDTPDQTALVSDYTIPWGVAGDYGQRYQGYLTAPVSGEYRFWLASDDNSALWIGTSDDKFSKVKVANMNHWSFIDHYGRYRAQASEPVTLTAGQRYYVEAQHKDGFGGHHFSMMWSYAEGGLTNWALDSSAVATQSSTEGNRVASLAIDGNTSGTVDEDSVAVTTSEAWASWEVDLGSDRLIDRIEIFNRDLDGDHIAAQLKNYIVNIYDSSGNTVAFKNFQQSGDYTRATEFWETGGVTGRKVKIALSGGTHRYLNLAEVRVLGRSSASLGYLGQTSFVGSDLESYAGTLNDSDNDDLPDDWETLHGFNPAALEIGQYSPAADTDKDGFHNALEAQLGGDPFVSESLAGHLTAEVWNGILGGDVESLVESDTFYEDPDERKVIAGTSLRHVSATSGARVRGYLTPTTTGTHYFWISARDGAEFWLSTDDTKYRKRRLSVMGAAAGTVYGVHSYEGEHWDRFSSQMSEGVELVAGQTYFFECLNQRSVFWGADLSVAWASPGADREILPASVVSSYGFETADSDDDYLPDAWETQYGLNPLDNGALDREREGERGDYDLDGLSNREEYLLGTDPSNADTDGDSLLDGVEVQGYDTDPTVSDAPSETLLTSVGLYSFQDGTSPWIMTTEGLISQSFRGRISWSFSVPTAGFWNINIGTRILGDTHSYESIPVEVLVDGVSLGSQTLVYGTTKEALLRVTTPELTAGDHLVTLDIDNIIARRSISITGLDIYEPGGADLDSDGVPDWITSRLTVESTLASYQSTSRTSPAFIEGQARISPSISNVTVQQGNDASHWFADVPLDDSTATAFTIDFESNLSESGSIIWSTTNVLDEETLIVRRGDSLKLSAVPTGGSTGQAVSFVLPAQTNYALDPGAVATQIGTPFWKYHAALAIDGETLGTPNWDAGLYRSTKTTDDDYAWWQVDLGAERTIDQIVIWNEDPTKWQLANFKVEVINDLGTVVLSKNFYDQGVWGQHVGEKEIWSLGGFYDARIVKIQKLGPTFGQKYLSLAEVQVFGIATQDLATDSDTFTYQFDQTGTQLVTATHTNGDTGTLTVEVRKADFDGIPVDLVSNTVGELGFLSSEIDSSLFFDGGDALGLDQNSEVLGDSFYLQATPRGRGEFNLLARLHEDGPIVGAQPLNLIAVSDALQNELTSSSISHEDSDYLIVNTPVVSTGLPDGGSIVVTITRAGVSFLDGTTTLTLIADDFVNGIYNLEFLFPTELTGGYCHTVEVLDRNGDVIARR